ncbi:hypothetical protein BJ741DRAFT_708521 [Chytriomyces cf. hyalinus JEL632]|nr:hypothetical protein BJ741DRAFT_708521 [Chytriomyces cf. hyalinus JEL632]
MGCGTSKPAAVAATTDLKPTVASKQPNVPSRNAAPSPSPARAKAAPMKQSAEKNPTSQSTAKTVVLVQSSLPSKTSTESIAPESPPDAIQLYDSHQNEPQRESQNEQEVELQKPETLHQHHEPVVPPPNPEPPQPATTIAPKTETQAESVTTSSSIRDSVTSVPELTRKTSLPSDPIPIAQQTIYEAKSSNSMQVTDPEDRPPPRIIGAFGGDAELDSGEPITGIKGLLLGKKKKQANAAAAVIVIKADGSQDPQRGANQGSGQLERLGSLESLEAFEASYMENAEVDAPRFADGNGVKRKASITSPVQEEDHHPFSVFD